MDNPICQLWGTMGPSMSTMLPPDVMGRATFCGRCKWCCVQDPVRSTGNAYSKVVHWGRRWKHLGKAHADWFKEPCSGGPDEGMPEETPMEWGILASDVNNNALPHHCKRQREIPSDSEETVPRPVIPLMSRWKPQHHSSTRRDPSILRGAEVLPRDTKTLLWVKTLTLSLKSEVIIFVSWTIEQSRNLCLLLF